MFRIKLQLASEIALEPYQSSASALSCASAIDRRGDIPDGLSALMVDAIDADDKIIRIRGSKASFQMADVAGKQISKRVRSFIRKWRATVDEDGQYFYAMPL